MVPFPKPPGRFEPPAPCSGLSVPPSALPRNKADLRMHCLILWSGAATVYLYFEAHINYNCTFFAHCSIIFFSFLVSYVCLCCNMFF